MDEYISERSEKWAESEAAEMYEAWKSEWETISFDEVDDPNFVDVDEFDSLPDEPEGT